MPAETKPKGTVQSPSEMAAILGQAIKYANKHGPIKKPSRFSRTKKEVI